MFRSLNLRFDLAKLSEPELMQRVGEAWRVYENLEREPRRFDLRGSWTGPVRHPLAYRILSVVEIRGGAFWRLGNPPLLYSDPVFDMHLTLCEIRDLMDELERRVARRRAHYA
jgi:hypothetical protein